jgi:branched-chain amino acid transport system ATP-binding protein
VSALLEVRDISAGFGAHQVLHGVSLTVGPGEVAGLFGLNGAGKSVLLKVVAGLVPAWSGRVFFGGEDVTALRPEARVALGLGHVPQARQVFGALTVGENLRLGAYTSRRRDRVAYQRRLDEVLDRFPVLRSRLGQRAATLSGGEQAVLAVARALVNGPKLVLVDEPTAGLSPAAVEGLYGTLRHVVATGVAMVLVEQNVRFGLRLAQQVHLLEQGRIVHSADRAAVDEAVLARHLGIGSLVRAGGRRFDARDQEATTR